MVDRALSILIGFFGGALLMLLGMALLPEIFGYVATVPGSVILVVVSVIAIFLIRRL